MGDVSIVAETKIFLSIGELNGQSCLTLENISDAAVTLQAIVKSRIPKPAFYVQAS